MSRVVLCGFLAGLFSLGADPAAARGPAICTTYAQTETTAIPCLPCRLTMRLDASARQTHLSSNNGWTAVLEWYEGGPADAEGTGRWGAEAGQMYGGQTFRMSAGVSESGWLSVTMAFDDPYLPQSVNLGYRCAD